ncbi:MAG: hypothetical protein JSV04_05255 [Candidatus Heimdallarchaeota archaeon]|nr:MAG: hypothetical protein JSV04_05255 [Candidatus Heimdallarchaeota archaeon]
MKKQEIKFDLKAIKAAEEEYQTVDPQEEQKRIIDQLAEIVSQHISISELAIKGMILLGIRKWQLEQSRLITDLVEMDPKDRILEVNRMIDNTQGFLIEAIVDREQEKEFDESIKKVKRVYKEKFAFR